MFKKILTLLIITSSVFFLLMSLPVLAKTKTTDYQVISAGHHHSLAVKSDGSLWAWGHNYFGQLGDGTTSERHGPVKIGSDNDWVMVSAGGYHSLAVKSDGSLWAWGWNYYGQLGNSGFPFSEYSPVRIGFDNDWVMVSAGVYHSLAVKSDGSLWAWGRNNWGQLGNGTTIQSTQPCSDRI